MASTVLPPADDDSPVPVCIGNLTYAFNKYFRGFDGAIEVTELEVIKAVEMDKSFYLMRTTQTSPVPPSEQSQS